ncbi:MAG: hypothetical protein J7574_08340 [Flavobacterium sp.]|uniref:hypothetical protein n=1 Tax=Flavobacterium sp. TaxID=239 RepID=UPI001B2A6331|nr:hypothetical protein [Flavobacterium sp.]MBO9584153.1 hypothetical protein [Flavobacterium sp.]
MKYVLFVGIFVYIFISTSVAAKIGIKQVGTYSSFILVVLFFLEIVKDTKGHLIKRFKEEFKIILAGLLIVFFKIFIGQAEQINHIIFFIIPIMLSVLLGLQNSLNRKIIRYLILSFFTLECFLAIYERLFLTNVFPYVEDSDGIFMEDWGFRSTAFLGHPLANALCLSVIMGFITISSLKLMNKLFFLILGLIALLCFNARAAIIMWFFLLIIYVVHILKDKNTSTTTSFLLLSIFCTFSYLIYTAVVDYGLGGRIIKSKINDGSAQARFDVFNAFSYISDIDFWMGNSTNYISVMKKLGAEGVENSYIVLIIYYGLPITVLLFFLYYYYVRRFLKLFSLFDKVIIISSFIIVGSANNGLVSFAPWGFFVLSAYCFPFFKKELVLENRKRGIF